MASVSSLLPLFRELNDLKRLRVAGLDGSIAERLFRCSWARLVAGESLEIVALSETANAVVAAKLAGIDAHVLDDGDIAADARLQILQRAFDASANVLPDEFARKLRAQLSSDSLTIQDDGNSSVDIALHSAKAPRAGLAPSSNRGAKRSHDWKRAQAPPLNRCSQSNVKGYKSVKEAEFVERLATQPRAGATRPGYARVVLEPTENHAEHCSIVAVNCVLASSLYKADAGECFLTGLSHHFHNAYLPDAGDAGDVLLGEYHAPLIQTFRERSLAQLPDELAEKARAALDNVYRADTPTSKSFQVADSLDRVLEMEWHARSAAFTLDVALDEMDIIHPGPVQKFQLEIMREAGFK